MKALLLALLLGTALSGALGVGYARLAKPPAAPAAQGEAGKPAKGDAAPQKKAEEPKDKKDEKTALRNGAIELPPIVSNLAAPEGVWVRLEGSVVVEGVEEKAVDQLKRDVTADILAYVATLSLPQLQGSLGLQHLREDIEERLALRSKGKAREFVIHMMVVQ
ncbi:MAG: flagellar basal body-associated FliL family protein [Methylobacteriaceae bacterium]|nr:flagellar basal body-associated FliL family protein [Methylobacteriaceae bacterium]